MTEAGPIMNSSNDRKGSRRAGRARQILRFLAGVLTAPVVLGGCSAVPGWADPTDWFAEDKAPTGVGMSQDQPGYMQSASFPNLASVPDTVPAVTAYEARTRIQESLAADRVNAEYSGERLVGASPSGPSAGNASASSRRMALVQTARVQQATRPPRVPKPPAYVPTTLETQAGVAAAPSAARSQSAGPAGVPPAPPIAAELIAPAASSPSPAWPQTAQTPAPVPAARPQLRFPQFQGPQFQENITAVAARPPALVGTQLVGVIYFGHGSARLDANDRGVLRDIVALQRQRGGVIRVVGHASALTGVVDQIRHRITNFEVSLKRANTVAAEIVALGAAKDKVRAEAKGDSQPVFHEFMATGEAGNRRAEIFLEF